MLGWKKHKLVSRLLGEMSITSDVQDLVFHYWADRDLRVAFSTHPESQASS